MSFFHLNWSFFAKYRKIFEFGKIKRFAEENAFNLLKSSFLKVGGWKRYIFPISKMAHFLHFFGPCLETSFSFLWHVQINPKKYYKPCLIFLESAKKYSPVKNISWRSKFHGIGQRLWFSRQFWESFGTGGTTEFSYLTFSTLRCKIWAAFFGDVFHITVFGVLATKEMQSLIASSYFVKGRSLILVRVLIKSSTTVVSEKKETFICELILERYIYLRNTQKQLKITNYVRNKSFLKFYLVYNDVCLKLLESLL